MAICEPVQMGRLSLSNRYLWNILFVWKNIFDFFYDVLDITLLFSLPLLSIFKTVLPQTIQWNISFLRFCKNLSTVFPKQLHHKCLEGSKHTTDLDLLVNTVIYLTLLIIAMMQTKEEIKVALMCYLKTIKESRWGYRKNVQLLEWI